MGRLKRELTLKPIHYFRESIIMMMRYGKSVDRIASDLGYPEKWVVDYIKSEGLDQKLSRRSWKWIEDKTRRRIMGGYNKSKKAPREIPDEKET